MSNTSQLSKSPINKLNIAQIFFLLFLVSLFFQVRYIFPNQTAFQTGAYSDFTSISLYLSDIFLLLTWCFSFLPRGGVIFLKEIRSLGIITLIAWLIYGLVWRFSSLTSLNWWFFVKYLELIVAYGTSVFLFRKTGIKPLFIGLFIALSSSQSILALWQFYIQRSVGGIIHRLGESVLSPKMLGIAKIVSSGTEYIRGYGTFPHPNLLSAFLFTSVLLCIYKFVISIAPRAKVIYSLALLVNLLGLTVTFSRAAFLALAIGLIILLSFLLFSKDMISNREKFRLLAILFLSVIICFAIFQPFLATRATVTDDASLQRIFYAKIGLKMVEQHPVMGLGIGDSMLHMNQYSPIPLQSWQIQPIHNYFLLAAAEVGIVGALILLWIFLSHINSLWRRIKTEKDFSEKFFKLTLLLIFIGYLILMQFDHYFYTLQQTQMLLWLTLGIIATETKKSPEGDLK